MKNNQINGRYFFYGMLGLAAVLGLVLVLPFLGTITLAFLTSLMFHPVYRVLERWTGGRSRLASGLTMLVVVVSFVLPVVFVTQLTIQQTFQFHSDIRQLTETRDINLKTGVAAINETLTRVNLDQFSLTIEEAQQLIDQTISTGVRFIMDALLRTGAGSVDAFLHLAVYFFLLYFLIPIQSLIPKYISRYSPLDEAIDRRLIGKAIEMARSMIRGTFVIAFVQSLVGGMLLYLFGVPYVVFWVVIMIFLAIIPLVGPSMVLVPTGIIYVLLGNVMAGLFIILFTILVVSNIDNVLRPRLVSKEAELHPALVLIGVLGGLKAFGVLGVIYGPVIMILLTTMLEVYREMSEQA
jgi:predicted PurR-regulated permease PerM